MTFYFQPRNRMTWDLARPLWAVYFTCALWREIKRLCCPCVLCVKKLKFVQTHYRGLSERDLASIFSKRLRSRSSRHGQGKEIRQRAHQAEEEDPSKSSSVHCSRGRKKRTGASCRWQVVVDWRLTQPLSLAPTRFWVSVTRANTSWPRYSYTQRPV